MAKNEQDAALKLVSTAYGVAIQPERFDELLSDWDDWADSLIGGAEQAFPDVSPMFDDALGASDHLKKQTPVSPLENSPVPTVLLDVVRNVVGMNAAAVGVFGSREDCSAAQFEPVIGEGATKEAGTRHLFRVRIERSARHYLAVEAPANPALRVDYPDAKSALFLSLMDWNEAFETELAERLDLSSAELGVARLLLEGRTAQEISGTIGRSLPTIRSHIKALLTKTGARRQSELVQFLTILRQVSDSQPPTPDGVDVADYEHQELKGAFGRLRVTRYGQEVGPCCISQRRPARMKRALCGMRSGRLGLT